MSRGRYTPPPWKHGVGFDGTIEGEADFAKCSTERQLLLIESFSKLVALATEAVKRGPETYRTTVEAAEKKLIEDRQWLAYIMAQYISATSVFARSAAEALEQELPEAAELPRDSGSDPQGGDAVAAPCGASQSGGSDSERIAQGEAP